MTLVYPSKNGCTNVLLIDKAVKDYQVFVDSVNPSTFPIVYSSSSSKEELLDVLRSNFTEISRIGLAFEISSQTLFLDNTPFYGEQCRAFLISVINTFSVKNIDYLACNSLNVPEWKAYFTEIATTGVVVGASDDSTGNLKHGGDWVMESTGQDVEAIYFTKKIDYYTYLLGAGYHLFVIDTSGILYAIGYNDSGQLGLAGGYRSSFTTVDISDVIAVSCGGSHSFLVKSNGTLWATGQNAYGQLGTGDTISRNVFTNILSGVVAVAGGASHSLAVKSDGTLWAAGNNLYGQLGTGDTSSRNVFTNILSGVIAVSCGREHSLAVKSDGTLWATGYNLYGQLGTGDTSSRNVFTNVLSGVIAVSCGREHSLAVKSDGTLWAAGNNLYGQLGTGDTSSRNVFTNILSGVKAVYCGREHSLALKSDGTLWATGANSFGQLGTGDSTPRNVFTNVLSGVTAVSGGFTDSLALKSDGTLWACGSRFWPNPSLFTKVRSDVRGIVDSSVLLPLKPTVTADISLTSVTLRWTATSTEPDITGYRVTKDGVATDLSASVLSQTYDVSANTTYTFTIAATNLSGTSVTTLTVGPPAAPTVTADVSTTSVTLRWVAPTSPGSTITGYRVTKDGVATDLSASALSQTYVVSAKTTYRFTVAASNLSGQGIPTARSITTPTKATTKATTKPTTKKPTTKKPTTKATTKATTKKPTTRAIKVAPAIHARLLFFATRV